MSSMDKADENLGCVFQHFLTAGAVEEQELVKELA